jgi:deoxyribodipyrimidine photo-lyase
MGPAFQASRCAPGGAAVGPLVGGRRAAEQRLAAIDPLRYGASRNHLDGAVTRLSPYIRHGVLTLAEVRDAVFAQLRGQQESVHQGELFASAASPRRWREAQRRSGQKLINELGWRDYWQRLWHRWGDGIWTDREPLKTGHPPEAYAAELPADIAAGATGLACIDGFAAELIGTGWLHNHARMWLAAYVVHWRRVRWQAGARWFLRHLLDGDPASNNLSWQWVASSFSHKPYIFNRANLERFSGGRACATCALAAGGCPFQGSYELLQAQLFRPLAPPAPSGALPGSPAALAPPLPPPPPLSPPLPLRRPLLWVHGEALGPANPALRAYPGAPALFVFDRELIAGGTATTGGAPLAEGRLRFLQQCLAELPVQVRHGDVAAELLAAAQVLGADGIVTSRAVDPRFRLIAARVAAVMPLQVLEPEPFVALPLEGAGAPDLRRFSRYWRVAEPLVWGDGDGVSS